MKQPKLLDLFCGAGGAARGYQRAGFHVTGIDIVPQPRYAGDVFIQADALEYCAAHGHEYDAIHASPPCQGYSRTRHLPWLKGRIHPLLIPATRVTLESIGVPWVIENVGDAPLDGIKLTGGMFGLSKRRLRIFESNVLLLSPAPIRDDVGTPGSMFGNRLREQQVGMGCDWMTRAEASQAIPPVYTEYLGRQLLAYVRERQS